MKRNYSILLITFFMFLTANAQELEKLLDKYQCKIEATTNNDSIYYFLDLKRQLLKNSHNYLELADIEIKMGVYAAHNGLLLEKHVLKSQKYALLAGDNKRYFESFIRLSTAKNLQGEVETAINYCDTLLFLLAKENFPKIKKDAYNQKINVLSQTGRLKEALLTINKAKTHTNYSQEELYDLNSSQARIYFLLGKYKESIKITKDIINHHKSNDSLGRDLVYYQVSLAKIYDDCDCVGKDERIALITEIIENAKSSHFNFGLAYAYLHMAITYMEYYELNNSYAYFEKVEKLRHLIKNKDFKSWYYEAYSRYWFYKKNYKKAIAFEQKKLEINKNSYGVLNSLEYLPNLYYELGDYKNAYEYLKQYQVLKDSLESREKIEELKALELQSEFDKTNYLDSLKYVHDKEITALKHTQEITEEKQAKIPLYISLLSISIIGLLIYIAYKRKTVQTETLNQKNNQIGLVLDEKMLLLKEIHHRVKNNFEVVSSLFELQVDDIEDQKALNLIKEGQSRIKIMAMIHEKLYQKESGLINFDDFVNPLVKDMISLHKELKEVNVTIESKDIEFDLDTTVPLGLMVNELITNAFKHAFSNKTNNELKVLLSKVDQQYYKLIVKDNGPGITLKSGLKNSTSLGLFLVDRLVKQLRGKIDIKNTNGTTFEILFMDTVTRNRFH